MIDPALGVPHVEADEALARYILHSNHIRRSTQTVKPDVFIPHPWPDLSVTRHLRTTEAVLWSVGEGVASATNKQLYGRADIRAAICIAQRLKVQADPVPDNPNHANVCGWPADKPSQKIIAQEIAAAAAFVARE